MSITQPTNATLYVVKNDGRTTLSTDITSAATTISVADITAFDATGGLASIYSSDSVTPGTELISYTGVSGSDLVGVTRGIDSTIALNADSADVIVGGAVAQHHNALRTALQALASETEDLRDGTDSFSEFDMYKTGAVPDGLTVEIDAASGGTYFKYDSQGSGQKLEFGPKVTAFEPIMLMSGTNAELSVASTVFRVYTKDNMSVAAQLGCEMSPAEADGASAVGYKFKTINDLANAAAAVLLVQNQSANVLVVRKLQTEAPKFVATTTTTAPINVNVFTSALSTPANGDVWLSDISSVRELNARISGVTYSIALT